MQLESTSILHAFFFLYSYASNDLFNSIRVQCMSRRQTELYRNLNFVHVDGRRKTGCVFTHRTDKLFLSLANGWVQVIQNSHGVDRDSSGEFRLKSRVLRFSLMDASVLPDGCFDSLR